MPVGGKPSVQHAKVHPDGPQPTPIAVVTPVGVTIDRILQIVEEYGAACANAATARACAETAITTAELWATACTAADAEEKATLAAVVAALDAEFGARSSTSPDEIEAIWQASGDQQSRLREQPLAEVVALIRADRDGLRYQLRSSLQALEAIRQEQKSDPRRAELDAMRAERDDLAAKLKRCQGGAESLAHDLMQRNQEVASLHAEISEATEARWQALSDRLEAIGCEIRRDGCCYVAIYDRNGDVIDVSGVSDEAIQDYPLARALVEELEANGGVRKVPHG